MAIWRFFDYVSGKENLRKSWYDQAGSKAQVEFMFSVKAIRDTKDFNHPLRKRDKKIFKALARDHKGLGEICFSSGEGIHKKHFRPVGIWPPLKEMEFIFLLGCEKTRGTYIPPGAFDIAMRLRGQLLNGIGHIEEIIVV